MLADPQTVFEEQSVPRDVQTVQGALAARGPLCRLRVEESAMDWMRRRAVLGAMLVSLGALAACDEGPAENAGEVVDETAEEAGDAVDDATD
jgi:hypothetical protein